MFAAEHDQDPGASTAPVPTTSRQQSMLVSSCFAPHSSLRLPASLTVLTRLDYGSVTLNGITKRLQD